MDITEQIYATDRVGRLLATVTAVEALERRDEQDALNYCRQLHAERFMCAEEMVHPAPVASFLGLVARAARSSAIQDTFGPSLISESLYRLTSMPPDEVATCAAALLELPVPQVLDVLQQLESIGGAALQSATWAMPGYDRCLEVVQEIARTSTNALVGYGVENAIGVLENSLYEAKLIDLLPPMGSSTYREYSRNSETDRFTEVDQDLRDHFLMPEPYTRGYTLNFVAYDVVGVKNRFGHLAAVAPYTYDVLPPKPPFPSNKIDTATDHLCQIHEMNKPQIFATLAAVHDTVLTPLIDDLRAGDDAEFASTLMGATFETAEWREILEVGRGLRECELEFRARDSAQEAEAQSFNVRHLRSVIDFTAEQISEWSEEIKERISHEAIARFERWREIDNLEMAYSEVETIWSNFQLEVSEGGADLLLETFSRFAEGIHLLEHARNRIELPVEPEENYLELVERFEKLADRAQSAAPHDEYEAVAFGNDLSSRMWPAAKLLYGKLVPFTPLTIEAILADTSVCPFPIPDRDQLTLLIGHVHRTPIRRAIERDLGIKLSDLDIRSQVHLVRFLSNQDTSGFTRIREALLRHPGHEVQLLTAFLTNAENSTFTATALELVERLPTTTVVPIISHYYSIVRGIGSIARSLRDFQRPAQNREDHREIAKTLLAKANRLLEEWARKGLSDTPDVVINRLEQTSAAVVLFGSTFKALGANAGISLRHVNDTDIDVCVATQLSARDREHLRAIAIPNIKAYPQKLVEGSLAEFESSLQNPEYKFYILRHKGDVVSFIKVREAQQPVDGVPGVKHLGSFQGRNEAQGLGVGMAFFAEVLKLEGCDTWCFDLDTHVDLPVAKSYLRYDFVGEQKVILGEPCLFMRRPPGPLKR